MRILTGIGILVVQQQQMAFRHLHSQDLVHSNNGTYSTTITFTDTQGTSSTDPIDSDDNQNVAIQDAESGQAGGETVMNSLHTFFLTLHTFLLMMNRQ